MAQDAIIRNIEVIGEAGNNVIKGYPDFVKENPEIEFSSAYQMRNSVAHGYFKIDLDVVWNSINTNIPRMHEELLILREQVAALDSDEISDGPD